MDRRLIIGRCYPGRIIRRFAPFAAYKVGMMKILELRQKSMDALGDKFDLRAFHDVVLKNGAVPLDILEQIVDEYIASHSS